MLRRQQPLQPRQPRLQARPGHVQLLPTVAPQTHSSTVGTINEQCSRQFHEPDLGTPAGCSAAADQASSCAAAPLRSPLQMMMGRRALLCAAGAASMMSMNPGAPVHAATAEGSTSATDTLEPYVNSTQAYRLSVPTNWERKDKAGADVLFEDPDRRSTSVGVTVSPVRVASIAQFGDLDSVAQRLMDAERKKESTLSVGLVSSSSRVGATGATLYDYEYDLDSTRGRKRILNTVTITGGVAFTSTPRTHDTGSRLYILNGAYKCDKEDGDCAAGEAGPLPLLRQVAASFDAGVAEQQ